MTPTTIMVAGGITACRPAALRVVPPLGGPRRAHRAATTPQPRLPREAVLTAQDLAGGLQQRAPVAVG